MNSKNENLVNAYADTLLAHVLTDKVKSATENRKFKDIARDVGLKPKALKRILDGEIRIPLEIVQPLAETLGISALRLARLTLEQYWRTPNITVDDIIGRTATLNEEEIFIDKWREVTNGDDPRPTKAIDAAVDELLHKLFPKKSPRPVR